KEKTLIYLKDKAVTEIPPSLAEIHQVAYAKVSAQDSNLKSEVGASVVSSGSKPSLQTQVSSYAYKIPEEKGARPASGSRSDRVRISSVGQLKGDITYTFYSDGSCTSGEKVVCLTSS